MAFVGDYLCSFCDEPVDPHDKNTYRRVIGWAPVKGSASSIALAEGAVGFACRACVDWRKHRAAKMPQGQDTMF